MLRRTTITKCSWSIRPRCAITGLIVIWQLHGRSGDELLASLFNAGFFLVLGLMIQSLSSFRSPHRVFRRVFRQAPHPGSRRDSFYIITPHFTSRGTGGNEAYAEAEIKFFNPSIRVRHKVTLDVVVAGNDAESAGALGSGIVKMTQGFHSPEFRTDAGDIQLDRPAVLFGLYSKSWVRSYWDYVKYEHGILKPHIGQAGFWVRSSGRAYKRILPLAILGTMKSLFLPSKFRSPTGIISGRCTAGRRSKAGSGQNY